MIYCIAKGGQTMYYSSHYTSPIGPLMLAANEESIIGLWLEGQKYFADTLPKEVKEDKNYPVIKQGEEWLDRYFAGGMDKKIKLLELEGADLSTLYIPKIRAVQ